MEHYLHLVGSWLWNHAFQITLFLLSWNNKTIREFFRIPPVKVGQWYRRYRLRHIEAKIQRLEEQHQDPKLFLLSLAVNLCSVLTAILVIGTIIGLVVLSPLGPGSAISKGGRFFLGVLTGTVSAVSGFGWSGVSSIGTDVRNYLAYEVYHAQYLNQRDELCAKLGLTDEIADAVSGRQ